MQIRFPGERYTPSGTSKGRLPRPRPPRPGKSGAAGSSVALSALPSWAGAFLSWVRPGTDRCKITKEALTPPSPKGEGENMV